MSDKKRRRVMGDDPLDAVLPLKEAPAEPAAEPPAKAAPAPAPAPQVPSPQSKPAPRRAPAKTALAKPAPTPSERERLTVSLPLELVERARDAVYWTPGLTLTGLVEEALAGALDRLEASRGSQIPPREGDIPVGRPVGSSRRAP